MAKWMEVMNQFNRMCWNYRRNHECVGCPMNGVNISQCRRIAFEQPEVTEKTVMDWAEENPEPVYPTWMEWLAANVPGIDADSIYEAVQVLNRTRIPADTAQKLNIKPKEGV